MKRHSDEAAAVRAEAVRAGLVWFAVYHLALAAWMAISPHTFYRAIGPFGPFNAHYLRDTATFNAALGAGFAVALARPSWRVPVVAITTLQFALHTINHLADAGVAKPEWIGWFDFASLLGASLLLAWMLRVLASTSSAASSPPSPPTAAPSSLPERSPT